MSARKFLVRHREKSALNQYWYSEATIVGIVDEIQIYAQEFFNQRQRYPSIAFLSTPSLFFALSEHKDIYCHSLLFDLDETWSRVSGFYVFDFNHPELLPVELHDSVDLFVIDPPFITREVWESYRDAVKLLGRQSDFESKEPGKCYDVMASTIQENRELMNELFGASSCPFQPSIPHLVYQYCFYSTFPVKGALAKWNPEIPRDDVECTSDSSS